MLDQQTIEAEVGIAGTVSDDVLKIAVPRGDLRVTVDGFEIIPFMGLTSWVAFRKGTQQTTVMGDIVLLEDEVGVAVSSAIEAGLYVTALHNHFIRSQPFVLFMHVEATSDEATLGRAVRKIVDSIKAVRLAHPVAPAVKQVPSRLDTAQLEEIIEAKGELKDGVFKFTLGRPTPEAQDSTFGDDCIHGYVMWLRINGFETPQFIADADGQRLLSEVR